MRPCATTAQEMTGVPLGAHLDGHGEKLALGEVRTHCSSIPTWAIDIGMLPREHQQIVSSSECTGREELRLSSADGDLGRGEVEVFVGFERLDTGKGLETQAVAGIGVGAAQVTVSEVRKRTIDELPTRGTHEGE